MARWTASAKWAAGPALDGQRDVPLALRLSEGLGVAGGVLIAVRFLSSDSEAAVLAWHLPAAATGVPSVHLRARRSVRAGMRALPC